MDWKRAAEQEGNEYKIPERWLFIHYYEAFNILFRIENALRLFVYVILKNEFRDNWDKQSIRYNGEDSGTINSIARKRIEQALNYGYLGYFIKCPIMHLTSGELINLITSDAYWKLFKDHFLGSKEIMKNKLYEIGSIRNSLAHFRPIKQDDVDVIKQNTKQVLGAVEKCMSFFLYQTDVVPTNIKDDWYSQLKTLGNENCNLHFYQSDDEAWIRISITFYCPVVKISKITKNYRSYSLLNLKSSSILLNYPELAPLVTYITEYVPYTSMPEDSEPQFSKSISMVFNRQTINDEFSKIKSNIEQLLLKISTESDLIQKDNLARGDMVDYLVVPASSQPAEKGVS